ncbi:MAG: YihY/virulence factor BrkB family protein [Opitutales bacterium]|nr:YihY/virulence factor BrkB family protein [Opitutales bacterium]MDP4643771.1 YihY/virulence factor BrkB family protein [Opitutales bacterium]MDP4777173.1 YihY/virulence factor BrkB family protein [Opitutales bacterium]MDP4883923.1 YihY/virulence factor BrkB family protein [Opitutales bacterium]MDP5080327.1 YihY/virulence factor BrkB family protein [Opitutales bacterium]
MDNKENQAADAKRKASFLSQARKYGARTQALLYKDIWELEHLGRKTVRARLYLLLRVLTLTFQGLKRNHIPMQAAALTFFSSIGIGPLIAFGIMISGFLLDKDIASDPAAGQQDSVVVQKITEIIAYAAPQVAVTIDDHGNGGSRTELAPELLELINNFSSVAKSGTVGVIGTLMLLFICLQVLTSIEKSFNTLWGVSQGRNFTERIVTYWTLISLGAVLGTAAISLQILKVFTQFAQNLPFGTTLASMIQFFSPVIGFIMIVVLLAVFLRFIPNTKVNWRPAFVGAVLVVSLLQVYKMLSFLYVQQVVNNKSLYGSVGIIVILMLGLYVFWLLILFGGQVTYAMQNADSLTNESAWQKTSERARELISLAVLIAVGQRFHTGGPPLRASEIHKRLRVPSHILNSSITRLCQIGYLYQVETKSIEEERDHAYQPAQPLESINLGSFKQAFECYGNNDGADLIAASSPAVTTYLEEVVSLKDCPSANLSLRDLL